MRIIHRAVRHALNQQGCPLSVLSQMEGVGSRGQPATIYRARYHASKDPAQNDIDSDTRRDHHTCDLEHGDGVALFGHSSQAGSAAFQVRREGGENFVLNTFKLSAMLWHRPRTAISSTLFGQGSALDIPSCRGYPDPARCRGYQWSQIVGRRPWRRGS